MAQDNDSQEIIDQEHLKLLSIFHYISGGLSIMFSLFLTGYFLFISFIIKNSLYSTPYHRALNPDFPASFFSIFLLIFGILAFLAFTFSICQILSARFIQLRKYRWFSFTVSIINLISIPYGTILGIMTIMVLSRDSIINLYSGKLPE